LFYVTNWYYFK